jgi:signal transduction histidine kinase
VLVSGEFGAVEGDEVLLRQAFSNLLRNAVEACAGASVAAVVAIRSEIDLSQKLSRITVNDNGPGIPAALRDRVFQPFFTSKRNGTGLGLALVRRSSSFTTARHRRRHGRGSLQVRAARLNHSHVMTFRAASHARRGPCECHRNQLSDADFQHRRKK